MFDPKLHLIHINSSVIISNGDGKVLMGLRSMDEESSPGLWTIPGGKFDATDKNLEEGVAREAMEETGVVISNLKLFRNNSVITPTRNTLFIVFTADYESGEATALEDTVEVRWFDKESIPNEDKCTRNTFKNIHDAMGW